MKQIEKFSLYKGDVELTLDGRHIYRASIKKAEPEIVYGVTSITNIISKPALLNWGIKACADEVMEEAKRLGWQEFCKTLSKVLLNAKGASKRLSKEAMDLGTRVHERAENWANKEIGRKDVIEMLKMENTEERLSCSALLEFFEKYKLEPIELEGKCFSVKENFAGTVDYIGKMDGVMTVLDYKTSKAVYEGYLPQVSAYAEAKKEEGYDIKQVAVVRVGKDGVLEVVIKKNWKEYYEAFLAMKKLYEYRMSLKGRKYKKVKK